jgi:hypothetical protein
MKTLLRFFLALIYFCAVIGFAFSALAGWVWRAGGCLAVIGLIAYCFDVMNRPDVEP